MSAFPLRFVLAGLFILILVVGLYWPGLHGGFFFDDESSILLVDAVRLDTLSPESILHVLTSGTAGPSGRPVAQLSFALNHYISGFNPLAFKATNLVIHLLCGLLVFKLTFHLLTPGKSPAKQPNVLIASGVVTALWLLHPIQLLPVLHVVQRMTGLSALFLLAALLLYIFGRERGGRAGTVYIVLAVVIMWPLSIFSKETGTLFPLFALAWELIARKSGCGKLDRFARVFAALTSLLLFASAIYALSSRGFWLWSGYNIRPFSLVERLLTEGRVLWFYLSLIVAPQMETLGLYHDDIVVSTGLFSPWTTLTAMLGLAGLVRFAWRARIRAPLVSFGVAWFLIGHTLESTALPLEIAHEHRNYLPILGILLVGAWAFLIALESDGAKRTIGIAMATAALAYFPFVTALRSHQFGNEIRRTQIEAQFHPASARAQYEAGRSLAGQPDSTMSTSPAYAFARKYYELASELDPDFKFSLLGLIHLNCRAKMPAEDADIHELARRLRETPFAPGDRNVLYGLKEMSIAGTICLTRPEMDVLFSAALANPVVSLGVRTILYSWYADYLWLHEHDMAAARDALRHSLKLLPTDPGNRLKWAQLLFISGEREQARQVLIGLRNERFLVNEQKTLKELLAAYNIAGH